VCILSITTPDWTTFDAVNIKHKLVGFMAFDAVNRRHVLRAIEGTAFFHVLILTSFHDFL